MLDRQRLEEVLARIPHLRIAVVGDFFLDKYVVIDPELAEISLETGLEARQVVEIRCSPGAAGTVTNNLSALGVGTIEGVGVIGDDGEGYDLCRRLADTRVRTDGLVVARDRFTPTYTKPMRLVGGAEVEMERIDIKNRSELDRDAAGRVQEYLERLLAGPGLDAAIVADQVDERNFGVVTDAMRDALADLGARYAETLFFADSRARICEFRGAIVKPNRREALLGSGIQEDGDVGDDVVGQCGSQMAALNGKPVFVTLGDRGSLVCTAGSVEHSPARRVEGPIDIVGAGDSVTAGIVCALCAGASLIEAADIGNLCASVTIRKLGTTGTASPDELRASIG